MVTIEDMITNLAGIDLPLLIEESINETGDQYAQMNADQMYEGKFSDGEDISPEYAESTKKRKKAKGQPFDRVTLRDKNDFHQRIKAKASDGEIEIGNSGLEYEKYLDKKYSKKIYGLGGEREQEYSFDIFFPVLQGKIEQVTNLQFS